MTGDRPIQANTVATSMIRNLNSGAALALAGLGAERVQADLNNPESLSQAIKGVHGVFSVQDFYAPGVGYDGEIRQARKHAFCPANALA